MSKLGITQQEAVARLQELATIPVDQLLVVQADGTKVADAGSQLQALASAQQSDPQSFALLAKYGPSLNEPKVQKVLTDVQKAATDSPKQWQHYFWIAVGGEVVFIPLIFVMAGFWDPRKAKQKEQEHEAWVQAELAKLQSQP
jgi:hypothetical protein